MASSPRLRSTCAASISPSVAASSSHCAAPAEWVDRLLALDFAIRRFHLASLVGDLDRPAGGAASLAVSGDHADLQRQEQRNAPLSAEKMAKISTADAPGTGNVFDPAASYADCTAAADKRAPEASIDMGTGYDCSDVKANTKSSLITAEQRKWRDTLVAAMRKQGFVNYFKEWWHFSLPGAGGEAYDFPILPRRP